MADITQILTQQEAKEFALNQLGFFIKEILPNRELVPDEPNTPIPTTDFLSLDILTGSNYSGGFGQQHIFYEMDATGAETYVYKDKVVLDLYTFIGNAYDDLDKLRTMLNNKYFKYKYFGSKNGLVGVTDIGEVRDNKISVYKSQETRSGARLRLALTYIYKVVDDHGEYIEEIDFTATTKVEDQEIVKTGIVIGY